MTENQENAKKTHKIVYEWRKLPISGNGIRDKLMRLTQGGVFDSVTNLICKINKVPVSEFNKETECLVYRKGTKKQCEDTLLEIQEAKMPYFSEFATKVKNKLRFIPIKNRSTIAKNIKPTKLEKIQESLLTNNVWLDIRIEKLESGEVE